MLVKEFNKDTKTFFAIECQKRLYKKISKYQKIEIYSSIYYGNILLLQDCFMLTEKNSNQHKESEHLMHFVWGKIKFWSLQMLQLGAWIFR